MQSVKVGITAIQQLDSFPLTKNQKSLICMLTIGNILEFFDLFLVGFVITLLMQDQQWSLSAIQSGLILAGAGLGTVIGAIFLGWLADKYGRKKSFFSCILLLVIFTGLAALTPENNWLFLSIMRVCVGIAVGGLNVTSVPYVQEFVPSKKRGLFTGLTSAFVPLGLFLGSFATRYLAEPLGWRGLLIIGCLPAILLAWIKFIPESPRYLVSKGRFQDAREAYAWAMNIAVTKVGHLPEDISISKKSYLNIIKQYPKQLTIVAIGSFSFILGSFAIQSWGQILLNHVFHFSINVVANLFMMLSLGDLVGRLFSAWLSDYLGRRRTLFLFGLIGALGCMIAALSIQISTIVHLLLFILVSANFSEGTLLNLPVSVVDHDHSLLSNKLIRNLNAAPHADIKAMDGTINTSLLRLGSAKDYALLYIPSHFERDVLTGRQPTVRMYYNALFYASGSYAIQDFSGVIAQLNAQFRPILASSMGRSIPPLARVTLSYDSLFNPSGNYIYYQQFAATIHMLQLFVITCTIYIMSRGTALLTNKTFTSALLGKLVPYTLFFTTLLLIEIAALSFFFDAKITSNPFYLLLVGFFYVIAAQSVGMLLFVFTKSIFTAYRLIGVLVSLALAFSGFSMPIMAMAWPAQIVANIQPLTHALNVMFDIFLREVSLLRVMQVCLILLIYPAICAFLIRNRLLTRLRMQEAF